MLKYFLNDLLICSGEISGIFPVNLLSHRLKISVLGEEFMICYFAFTEHVDNIQCIVLPRLDIFTTLRGIVPESLFSERSSVSCMRNMRFCEVFYFLVYGRCLYATITYPIESKSQLSQISFLRAHCCSNKDALYESMFR